MVKQLVVCALAVVAATVIASAEEFTLDAQQDALVLHGKAFGGYGYPISGPACYTVTWKSGEGVEKKANFREEELPDSTSAIVKAIITERKKARRGVD